MKCKNCGRKMEKRNVHNVEYFVCDYCKVKKPLNVQTKKKGSKYMLLIAAFLCVVIISLWNSNESVSSEYLSKADEFRSEIESHAETSFNIIQQYDNSEISLDDFMGMLGKENGALLTIRYNVMDMHETEYTSKIAELANTYYTVNIEAMNYNHENDATALDKLSKASVKLITLRAEVDDAKKDLKVE